MKYEEVKKYLDADVHLHKVFDTIDSTNTYLKNLCRTETVSNMTAVLADSQSGGRGRLGRSFVSLKGNGIFLSVALDASKHPDAIALITSAAAVAVCRVLDKYTREKAQIKWVNDVYLGGKKVCGILTEAVTDASMGQIRNIIVGVGLNVCGFDAFDEELKSIVTTLDRHADCVPPREVLAAQIINALCDVYAQISNAEVMQEYRARSFVIAKDVRVIQNGKERNAHVTDVDESGGLCVTYEDGESTILRSAEISIRSM